MIDIQLLVLLLTLGTITGLVAGLFGIGGGGIMVPILTILFSRHGFAPEHVLHIALATSMAAIVPTACSSLIAHHRHRAVLWAVALRMAPGVLTGTFLGSFLASFLSTKPLAIFFSAFMAMVALRMIWNKKPEPTKTLPDTPALISVGSGIGVVSALVAIGGGTLTVPFLMRCNVQITKAIGTSAAVGLPIALAGAVGYWMNGRAVENLPDYMLGYIFWPAVASMAVMSLMTAPMGAKLAHRLPTAALKKLFALLLIVLSTQMLFTIFS